MRSGLGPNAFLGNCLIIMYGKCGSMEDSRIVFDTMQARTIISWTAMIAVHADHRHGTEAFSLFRQMLLEGMMPNRVTFMSVLKACDGPSALEEAKMMQVYVFQSGFESDVIVGNALVSTYGNCGSAQCAQEIFDSIQQRTVVSWTAMVGAYAQLGQSTEALQILQRMQEEGVKPNEITFVSALSACSNVDFLADGRLIHFLVVTSGSESQDVLSSALVTMYGNCESLDDAHKVFDHMHLRSVVSWNAMISMYCQHGHSSEALDLFKQMELKGVMPNMNTFIPLLNACASPPVALTDGKVLHSNIVERGLELDIVVGSALISMYGVSGRILDAWTVFQQMHRQNVVSCTAMIGFFAQHGHGKDAFRLYQQMRQEGIKPNEISCINILSACVSLEEGQMFHAHVIESGFESVPVVGNALVSMYGSRFGCVLVAAKLFDQMDSKNVVSWNAIIGAYCQHRHEKEAIQLFQQMELEGVMPNKCTFLNVLGAFASLATLIGCKMVHTRIVGTEFVSDGIICNAILNTYSKCGALEHACKMFEKMHERNLVSWNTIFAIYTQHGHGNKLFELFQHMQQEGVQLDEISFVSLISACVSHETMSKGRVIHMCVIENGFETDAVVGTALITMYGNCGSVVEAYEIFDRLKKPNVVSWNAMIAVYAHHGYGNEALLLTQRMQLEGIKPNESSYVSILSLCSHSGLVDEGSWYFLSMSLDYGITPTSHHYSCMIDLFGRAGRLDEAEKCTYKMPFEPGIVEWMSLLSACRNHGDVERGKWAVDYVLELDAHTLQSMYSFQIC